MTRVDSVGGSRTVAVVIGRNEGDRLQRCLESLVSQTALIVYVDSGSTDASVARAAALGAMIVQLDTRLPFTAARARNAGFAHAMQAGDLVIGAEFIQFVDGDCEIVPGWLDAAASFLDTHDQVAAVCGRRRERFPHASIYNLVCDLEWDTPIGEAKAFGGDVLIRSDAFRNVGGYRDGLIAGEEPELALRLRQKGWSIWRLDVDMTWHDAAILRYTQWWKRSVRAGYAFAEGAALHGERPERHWVQESRRAALWGALFPLLIFVSIALAGPWGAIGFLIYPIQMLRQYFRLSGTVRTRLWRAGLLVIGKFAEALGCLKFLRNRWWGSSARLIEYK